MNRREILKTSLFAPFIQLIHKPEPEPESIDLNSFAALNQYIKDGEKAVEQEYLKQTGWPIHVKFWIPPSMKVDIVEQGRQTIYKPKGESKWTGLSSDLL